MWTSQGSERKNKSLEISNQEQEKLKKEGSTLTLFGMKPRALIHEKEPLYKYFVYRNESFTFVFPSGDATSVLKMSGVIDGWLSLVPEP